MSDNLTHLDSDTFTGFITDNKKAIIDLWAEWCQPCLMIAPVYEELAGQYAGQIAFGKLDVDSNQQIAMQFGVQGIPTFLLFSEGELWGQIIGANKPKIELFLDFLSEASDGQSIRDLVKQKAQQDEEFFDYLVDFFLSR